MIDPRPGRPQLRVLGTIRLGSGPAAGFSRRKVRSLAALLSRWPGQVVSTERLIEELWDSGPPASARTSLRVHVSSLRTVLKQGGTGLAVEHREPGYRLVCGPGDVDASRAERLLRSALDTDSKGVVDLCDEALALWDGEAYADVDLPCLDAERHRLGELRLSLLELRAGARARAAPPDVAFVAELEDLVEQAPLRERLTELLMLALFQMGREVESLAAFQRLRARLADEQGLQPSRALQELEHAVLVQAPTLDWAPTAGAGRSAITSSGPEPALVPAAPSSPGTAARSPVVAGLRPFTGRFVGRAGELAQLRRSWDARQNGRGVVVRGEAGIGKTRLVTELAGRLAADGATIVAGTCDPEGLLPYRPFVEILRQIRDPGGERRPPLAPQPSTDPAGGDGAEGRLEFFNRVSDQLEQIARSSPTGFLVIVEDLQWLDDASAALLRYLLRAQPPLPLFIMGTARSDEPDESLAWSRLRSEWARHDSGISRLELGGLSLDEVATMVAERPLPRCLDDADPQARAAKTLFDLTGGNPLLVDELVADPRLWIESGPSPGGTRPVPATVAETARHRLRLLTPEARHVVEVAAVAGDRAPTSVIADASGRSAADVYRLRGEAVATHLLVEDDAHPDAAVFKHELVRLAVAGALPAASRQELHLRLAAAHARTAPPGAARDLAIARHLLDAVPACPLADAAEAAATAAEGAVRTFAFEEAVALAHRTLTHRAGAELQLRPTFRLLCAQGLAEAHLGRTGEAAATFAGAAAIARELDDAGLLAVAALGGDLPDRPAVALPGREALLLEALPRLAGDQSTTRVRVLSALALDGSVPSRFTDRRRLADEAVALARNLGEPPALFRALTSWYLQHLGDPAIDTRRAADEMVHLGEITGDATWTARARLMRARELLNTGDMAGAEADLAVHRALAERTRRPRDRWQAHVMRAALARLRADLAAAETEAAAAAALSERAGLGETALVYGVHVFFTHFHRGALAELAPSLAVEADTYGGLPVIRVAAALAAAHAGDLGPVRAALPLATADDRPRDELAPTLLAFGAMLAIAAGDRHGAEVLARDLRAHGATIIIVGALTGTLGPADRYRAMLARHLGELDEAEQLAEAAVALADKVGATIWSLWSRAELAASLAPRDPATARRLADEVIAAATALGVGGPASAAAAATRTPLR